ncbi:unnamed protein product [Rhizophagus irregularis]|uniref:WRKY domain-containing protein n=1 Tax=Rhizophagus irregularis TaxID=588596 RepID=A0A2I1H347_9GLOM|nr:hypothetical protein RhiirA4_408930 [Rhizophagus irregularis]CAB4432196.1 unnamed protein product [Rhizophagus irregularis]
MSSRGESTYAQYPYTPPKNNQQLLHHHQYTQQNQFTTTPQDGIISQTPSGTPNPQYTTQNTSIGPPSLSCQTRRYKASIAPNNTPRQYPSTIAPPLNERPPSPLASTQCLPTNNNVPSTLPASLPTPPPIPAGLSSPNNTTTASSFDLQDIILQFGGQPELLKIILTSKVEEDKRKAEEAKLRVKELDLMLCDKHRKCNDHDDSKNDEIHSNQDMDYDNENSIGTYSTSDGTMNYASFNTSLSSHSLSLNPSSTPVSQSTPRIESRSSKDQDEPTECEQNNNCAPNKRKRKRREMLPVTMIIETKEHPYVDDYLWKNNGNTTQRKTGNKSVYFKCSNSNKGCPVNKTVTEKDGGWIIKYRGCHLDGCGKIKRIVQS